MSQQPLIQAAVISSLNRMMKGRRFDICTVRDAAELLGVDPHGEAYRVLRTQHCAEWDTIPQELRREIPNLIRQCLGQDEAPQFYYPSESPAIDVLPKLETTPEKRPPFLQRLRSIL